VFSASVLAPADLCRRNSSIYSLVKTLASSRFTMEFGEALTGGWRGEDIDWISRLESEGRLEGLVTRLSTRGRALTHYRES
jgi:hypothetical protein